MSLYVTAKIAPDKDGEYWLKIPAFNLERVLVSVGIEKMIEEAEQYVRKESAGLKIPTVIVHEPEISIGLRYNVEGQKDRKLTEFSESVTEEVTE